jgi:ubiquinone/menaquinone biosynthesis C-methylase UbiE
MEPPSSERAKRAIARLYSGMARHLYEPLVVKGAFRLFGGSLIRRVFEHGRAAVEAAPGAPILDMPVGTGFFAAEMAALHNHLVVGVDIARGMVERSAERARERGLANLAVVQGDAHHLPFPDGVFGAVVCSNGLQVIPGLDPAVRELVRVLAPGGYLFCSVLTAPIPVIGSRAMLPTVLRPGGDVARAFERAGLEVLAFERARFATLIRARREL